MTEYLVRPSESASEGRSGEESNGVGEKVISVDKKSGNRSYLLLLLLLLLLSRYCIRLNSDDLKVKRVIWSMNKPFGQPRSLDQGKEEQLTC